jgi:TonB family protein
MKQKLKIMKTRPQVTDEEIRSYMDFDSVVALHKQRLRNGYRWFRYIAGALITAGIGTGIYFYSSPNTPDTPVLPQESKMDSSVSKTIEQPKLTPELHSKNNEEKSGELKKIEQTLKTKPTAPADEALGSTDKKNAVPQYAYVEAQPINGFQELYEYFSKELRYPDAAVKDSIEGIVTVFFVISKEGKPVQISTENSLGEAFDQEALRLIQNMPEWKAATVNGKPVPSRISIPLTFQIVKTKNLKQ